MDEKDIPEKIKYLLERNREKAATVLTKDMDPQAFAEVVKARANLILYFLSHQAKLTRDGMDTYANILAMCYAVGAISDKIPGFSMFEVITAISAGQSVVEQLGALEKLAATPSEIKA